MAIRKLLSRNVCGRIAINELTENHPKNSLNILNPFPMLNRCTKLEVTNIRLFQRQCRYYCTLKENETNAIEPEDTSLITQIAGLLDWNVRDVRTMVKKNPIPLSKSDYISKINILKDNCLSVTIIKKNPWLLSLSEDDLKSRFQAMKELKLSSDNICSLLPLLKLSAGDFQRLMAKFTVESTTIPEGNRVFYLAKELQCSPTVTAEHLVRHKDLLYRSFIQISNSLKCYKDYGIPNEKILKTIRVLNYTRGKIRQRFETALKRGAHPLTLKLLYAPENNFEQILQESVELAATLKEIQNVETYFYNQLDVNEQFISQIKENYPHVLKTKPKKVKRIMEFLLNSGYSKEEIKTCIYIFGKREESVKERYAELSALGHRPTLAEIHYNKYHFDRLVGRLKIRLENFQQTQKNC